MSSAAYDPLVATKKQIATRFVNRLRSGISLKLSYDETTGEPIIIVRHKHLISEDINLLLEIFDKLELDAKTNIENNTKRNILINEVMPYINK